MRTDADPSLARSDDVSRELSLKTYPEGIRLVQQPVAAIEKLRGEQLTMETAAGQVLELLSTDGSGRRHRGRLALTRGRWNVHSDRVRCSGKTDLRRSHQFRRRGVQRQIPSGVGPSFQAGSELKLHVLIDRMSVEVFAGDGQIALTNLVFPPQNATRLEFYSRGASSKTSAKIWKLKSIW